MYNKITLNNGIRIVTENIPYVKSASIGIWVEAGARKETRKNNGVSHFIEHMLFKGTKKRTAKEIAESIDSIGGQINAFTSKECTCYYVKVLDNHLPIAIDVLGDMLLNSTFTEEDIIKEKSVVLEEIGMYEDSPEDKVYDLLSKTIFNDNSLSFPILGSSESLKQLSRDMIMDYFLEQYIPSNIVISIAGNFEYDSTISLVEQYFGNWSPKKASINLYTHPVINQNLTSKVKDTEQLHFCLGMEGISQGEDNLYSLLVLNNIFGGSMSSRLFQKIREEHGLVYSIYSYPSSYKDVGIFTVYAGLNPNQIINVAQLIMDEIKLLKKNYLKKEDIHKSKEQLKGNYILGLESTSSRMTALGKSELLLRKTFSPKDILEKIDKVTLSNINEIIEKVFDHSKFNISYVGKIADDNNIKKQLKGIYF